MLDFDGTIVDSNNIKYKAFFDVVEKMGRSDDGLLQSILEYGSALTRYDVADRLARELGPSFDKVKFLELYSLQCRNEVGGAPFVAGALEFLNYLFEQNIPLVLSSATDENDLKFQSVELGIAGYFELIMGSPSHKIDHMEAVLTYFECETKDILSIGDSHSDYNVAVKVGVEFIGIGDSFDLESKAPTSFQNFLTLSQHFIETRQP